MRTRAIPAIVHAIPAAMLVVAGFAGSAFAHHPTGGMTPATLWHGVLSGIGHPILGLDHFAFIVGIGLLAGIAGFGLRLPALFVAAMAAGLGVHVTGLDVPRIEMLVALSVVLIGAAVLMQGPGFRLGLAFAAAGLLHGYAFAETVIGAETTPLAGYIAGLAVTQMAIAGAAWLLARSDAATSRRIIGPAAMRFTGVAIAAVGAYHLVVA